MQAFIRREGIFLLLIVVIAAAAFSPLLFFGKAFFDEEQIGFYYPQSFFYQQELLRGSPLVWNSGYYAGVPVGMDQFVSAHYPLHQFLFRFFNFFDAHHISIVIAVSAGCLFAYWFGRASGFLPISSFVLGIGYLLATSFGWLAIGTLAAHAFFVLPALLLALLKINRKERALLFIVLGGGALGVGFLAGFMQIVFYTYAVAFLYALFLDWQGWRVRSGIARFRATLGLIAITALALVLGARQILPSVFLIDLSIRTPTYALEHAGVPSIVSVMALAFPNFLSLPFFRVGLDGFYVGPLLFMTAAIGIFFFRTPAARFFLAAWLMVLGFAFHLPVLSWVNEHIPPFSRMGENFRWTVINSFPLAYLAAHGFQGLITGAIEREKLRRAVKIMGLGIVFLFVLVFAFYLGLEALEKSPALQQRVMDWYFAGRPRILPPEHYREVLATAIRSTSAAFSPLRWQFVLMLFLWPAAYFLLKRYGGTPLSDEVQKRFAVLAAFFVSFNALAVYAAQYEKKLVEREIFTVQPALVREIKKREQDPNAFRIAGFMIGEGIFEKILSTRSPEPADLAAIQRELLVSNVTVYHGIQRLDGLEPYRTLRHNRLLNTVLFPPGREIFDPASPSLKTSRLDTLKNEEVLRTVSPEEKIADFLSRLPLLSMLNVKYLYSLFPLDDPRLKEIAMPVNLDVPAPVYVYENNEVLPRIYFADGVEFVSDTDTDALVAVAENRDFRKKTFIECTGCAAAPLLSGHDEIAVQQYENGLVRARVATEKGGWLIFGESAFPGWTAKIDGAPVPIYTANYLLQAVHVPAGVHEVIFTYHDVASLRWQTFKQKIMTGGKR